MQSDIILIEIYICHIVLSCVNHTFYNIVE